MNIIFEDNSIIVINKPSGVASQSANITQKDCVSLIKEHLKRENPNIKGEPYVGIVHRLDQPVSGVMVYAKTQKAAANLSKQVQTDVMNKKYLALCEGEIKGESTYEELRNYIYKDAKNSKSIIVKDKNKAPNGVKVQEAILRFKTIKYYEKEDVTLLDISLVTGRFHQIRCQLSEMGHPIVNDKKYGSKMTFTSDFTDEDMICGKGISLKAYELTFIHPDTGKKEIYTIKS